MGKGKSGHRLTAEDRRTICARVYLSPVEAARIAQAAIDHDMTRSEYMRCATLASTYSYELAVVDVEGALLTLCEAQRPADA